VATQLITRGSLRDEILDRLRSLLVEGDLPPGARINESTLARELGISRTPLREALLLLSGEGLIACEPARGFLAAPLTVDRARDAFPILAALEVLALRSSKGVALHRLDQLRSLHSEYESAPTLEAARVIDERWHRVLTSGCSNESLNVQLERQRAIERRYWLATAGVAGRWPQPSWVFQHAAVMEAVDDGDTEAACAALERHWGSSMREALSSLARNGG
jgi:DNA-binding GntR family transcriptional regulator